MKKTSFLLLLISFLTCPIFAQTSINTCGGSATGSQGSTSYSVGQLVNDTYEGTNYSITEGIQQPYEISTGTGIDKANDIHLKMTAYPNPTTDYLILKVENFDFTSLQFLYNIDGILLQNKKITTTETRIVMSHLVSATYFIKIINKKGLVKSFKIIKH